MARYAAVEGWLNNHLSPKIADVIDEIQPVATRVRRAASSSPTCTGPANLCEKAYTSISDQTIPIALGVAIPLTFAMVVFYIMWRRNIKRMRREDATDKHASLDFGLGEHGRSEKQNPVVTQQEKDQYNNRSRGLSLEDMMEGPFVIPSGERGSMQSLSRLSDTHDPYRPVHLLKSSSQLSLSRPPTYHSRPVSTKSASIWTSASGSTAHSLKSSLVANAQNPSRTDLLTSANGSSSTSRSNTPPNQSPIEIPEPVFISARVPISPVPTPPPPHQRLVREGSDAKGAFVAREPLPSESRTPTPPAAAPAQTTATTQVPPVVAAAIDQINQSHTEIRKQPTATQPIIMQSQPVIQSIEAPSSQQQRQRNQPAPINTSVAQPQSGRTSNRARADRTPTSPTPAYDTTETYADVLGIAQKESRSPPLERSYHPQPMPTVPEGGPVQSGLGLTGVKYDTRSSPPAEDVPESAELRANRVRSFYKEYFDSSPIHNQQRNRQHARKSSSYSQGYNQEHFHAAPMYDPMTGEFYMAGAPYAQPMNRRAMTPPPRAPPRSFRNSPGPRSASGSRRPRGYSAASAPRPGGTPNSFSTRGRTPRRAPPPAPLTVLPNPAQMKDDSAIYSPTDFAPPASFASRAAGMSPTAGEKVPYQPSRRAFSPLASSFDDLAFMPSPHNLRKSASFTALDFAPPSRFAARSGSSSHTNESESGSVRSGKSYGTSVSAAQLASIRAGAYRLSRLPRETVGSKGEIDLKPKMDIGRA